MKAIAHDTYGTAEGLELREMERPAIADDEVLIRVHAAGVDRGVWHLMTGLPYPLRFAGYGIRTPKNPVLGMDLAGVVEAVGSQVTRFRAGDEVFGIGNGSFAEFARAPEAKLAPKPADITFEQAASVAISGLTALHAVRDQAQLKEGQRVLIIGASGGVGSYAVQLAKAAGVEVTGVCSTGKVELVRSLGADHVIDYTRHELIGADGPFDVILDIGGNRPLSLLRSLLTHDGRLVIVGGENGGRWLGGSDRQIRAMLMSPFVSQKLGSFISKENGEDLLELKDLIDAGTVTPAVGRTYPLADAAVALNDLEQGRAEGKLVLTVA